MMASPRDPDVTWNPTPPLPISRFTLDKPILSSVASCRSFSASEKIPLPFWSTLTVRLTISKSALPTTSPNRLTDALALTWNSTALPSVSAGIRLPGSLLALVATAQSMRGPPATLVLLSLTAPLTWISTPLMPTSDALPTVTSSPVKLVVPLLTVARLKLAPLAQKPTAPVVEMPVRVASSAPPSPTKRLAPLMVNARTLAPSIRPAVAPRPVMFGLPVVTLAVAMSRFRLPITATTLPPMSSEALPLACSSCALVSVRAVIRLFGSLVASVAVTQLMRGPPTILVLLSLTAPLTRTSMPSTPIRAALVTAASRPVKFVVPLLTLETLNEALPSEKPTAPVVTMLLRSAESAPPSPTKRLAPVIEKEKTLAPSIRPGAAPSPVIDVLPVTTSIVPRSSCSPPAGISAIALPLPMLRAPPAVTRVMAAVETIGKALGIERSWPGSSTSP